MTWNSGASVTQIAWGQVKPQAAASDNGIDFEYQLTASYPMILSNDRPFLLLSSISEGAP